MRINKYIHILLFFVLASTLSSYSQTITLSDSARISLLTNSAWDKAIYSLFGHTAIRVSDKENNIDYAFNYGIFDFNSSDFIYRFVKGETDYMVAGYDFKNYLYEYENKGVSVFEQVLNLTQTEKQELWNALCINSLPKNRIYRYNFFFDNCATRPRDIIAKNISGTIDYKLTNEDQTFRDLVRECVDIKPWVRFGIDLIIGNGADRNATEMEKMFLPLYLKNAYNGASIVSPDTVRNLVSEQHYVLDFREGKKAKELLIDYPLIVGCVLLVITLIISIATFRRKYSFPEKIFDSLLFITFGAVGCVIAFLMFVSEHPCTNPNWNLVWANPIQLISAFLFFPKYFSKYVYCYHFINFALLSLFLLCWFIIPQQLEIAFIPFILALGVRSGTNIARNLKRKSQLVK